MNLFLCTTPFQLFLSSKIIKKLNIKPGQAFFFYVSSVDNEVVRNNILMIKNSGFNIEHLKTGKETKKLKLIILRLYLLRKFFHKKYGNVYIASIDSKVFHFILSWIKFDKLYTFDDGTANIIKDSIYYRKKSTGIKRKAKDYMSGVKYNMDSVKDSSCLHYTVYNQYDNIIKNTCYISLSEKYSTNRNSSISKNVSCSVFLGTVYHDVFEKNIDIETILTTCLNLIKNNDNDLYYIPHPRETSKEKPTGLMRLTTNNIAEKEIENLLDKYSTIFLYGFMSSSQLNLASNTRINNNIFYSEKMKYLFKKSIKSNLIPPNFNIIKINIV